MIKDIKIAVVQAKVPSTSIEGEKQVERFVKTAAEKSIDMIGLPEDCLCLVGEARDGYDPLVFISDLAKKYSIYIFGSNFAKNAEGNLQGLGFLFDRQGKLVGSHAKTFLTPSEKEINLKEGNSLEVFETEFGIMSILICREAFHRFSPWLFYQLWKAGVEIVLVPSWSLAVNPDLQVNIDQWLSPLKTSAKAFEMYIAAPGTIGKNITEFPSFGHAIILGPRAKVLAEGSVDKEELLEANLDTDYLNETRATGKDWQPQEIPELTIQLNERK